MLVLDRLPLQPLIPYQTVSQYGFKYTLVPYNPDEGAGATDKATQTAVPTFTLGTQTHLHRPRVSTQASQASVNPASKVSLDSASSSSCMPECGDSSMGSHFEMTPPNMSSSQVPALPLDTSQPLLRSSTPIPKELNITVESEYPCDPHDTTFQLSSVSESTDSDEFENEEPFRLQHTSHTRKTCAADERLFIVAESCLRELLSVCPSCQRDDVEADITLKGTCVRAKMTCGCQKQRLWYSQPWVGNRPLGNVLLCCGILFSGTNIAKALRMLKIMGVPALRRSQFYKTQQCYLFPAVNNVYETKQQQLLEELRPVPLTLAGDGRCDSQGHTALYGTYTLLETTANRIVHFELVKVTEVTSSNAMEKHGLQRCLAFLEVHDMVVDMLVTDRHTGIKAMMRDLCPHIKHQFDVWHVVEGIKKKLLALGRAAKHQVVQLWIESIVWHAYWCQPTPC
ncbi:uncharacterized protein LOC135374593 isoform X2 [Ornithodoros turicata]|uniref:uncharacterized protein LOC135374593 isoform X2 n=1 Tax=Ornithodoros turicata TaxID=34597 RepID=UPI003138A5E8